MNLRDELKFGAGVLEEHKCPGADPVRDAELLLAAAAGKSREWMLAHPQLALSVQQRKKYLERLSRRLKHEPVAYVNGSSWFYGREFAVSSAALIPRWATESIVEEVVKKCRRRNSTTIIDAGTGSGCIAIIIAAECPQARIFASDVSPAALRLARKNAARHRAKTTGYKILRSQNFITFRRGDLLEPFKKIISSAAGPLIIAANLPYIPTAEIKKLPPDIRRFEPGAALDGGADGLLLYKRLIAQLRRMRPDGGARLFFEMLPEQYPFLSALIQKKFPRARAKKIVNLSGVCVGLTAVIGARHLAAGGEPGTFHHITSSPAGTTSIQAAPALKTASSPSSKK